MNEQSEPGTDTPSTASDFLAELPEQEGSTTTPGIKMRDIFALAKKHMSMGVGEIEKLLKSSVFEHRVGAVSIMDWRARNKKIADIDRKALFDLYLKRHDHINDWSLVDRAAPYVVGGYLDDKPRDSLHQLALSKNRWERRTAIVSTYYFIRKNDLQTTFDIAAILVEDPEHFVQTAVGGWLREAGKKDQNRLINFLDQYYAVMPSLMLRFAVEHLDKKQREHYVNAKKNVRNPFH